MELEIDRLAASTILLSENEFLEPFALPTKMHGSTRTTAQHADDVVGALPSIFVIEEAALVANLIAVDPQASRTRFAKQGGAF